MTPAEIICSRLRIAEWLESNGHELTPTGGNRKCRCPFADHVDSTPSFYIGEFEDGAEWFKCWGCSRSGNAISFLAQMQGKDNGQVVRELCSANGIDLGDFDPRDLKRPLPKEVIALFCEEDWLESQIATYGRLYLSLNGGSEDSVNKISRAYQKMDKMIRLGDNDGLRKLLDALIRHVAEYAAWREEKGLPRERILGRDKR